MKRFWWFSCEGVQFVRSNTHGVLVPYGMFTAQLFVDQNRTCVFCYTLAPDFRPNHIFLVDGNSNRAVGWNQSHIELYFSTVFHSSKRTGIDAMCALALSFTICRSHFHHILYGLESQKRKKSVIDHVIFNFTND